MNVADDLKQFLTEMSGSPLVWGLSDCSATPHAWLIRRGFKVSLPTYRTKLQAHDVIDRAGSLVAAWDDAIAGALPERAGGPRLGDVAVIDTRLHGQIGGIVATGNILIIRKDDGEFSWFGPVRRFEKVWAAS